MVREELGRREERRREERNKTLSMEEMMAKCSGVLEKHSKLKKMILKKAKAEEAREKRTRAAEAQRAKIESIQEKIKKEAEEKIRLDEAVQVLEANSSQTKEEMKVELGKLEALMEEDSAQDRREEVECPVCCEEMAPPRTIFQCSQGHPVCSSCRPRLVHCPSCREAFMGRARGMEQLVLAVLDREAQ